MSKKKRTIHVVSYTHWDREFRFDFESTRMRLVDLVDNLLTIMSDNPAFKHFMLDGQYVLLDDYLEIRPEKEAELRSLAAEGRLAVGPWYTLPDSSCIHGESLIRNLMTGLRKSREFGGAMEIGYNVFSFGQIAQLPQIYGGFGINFIVFYKNMDPRRSRSPEFTWESRDGSRATATRLGPHARWNFFFAGHIPIVYGQDPWHKDWRYEWGSLGKLFHLCDPAHYASFHDILDPETGFGADRILDGFERAIDSVKGTSVPEDLLFFDGTDFTEPHPCIPEILATASEQLGDQFDIVHDSLEGYVSAAREQLADREIETVRGEMRDGPEGSVHADVCSIHPELKRACTTAENALFRWAEPLAASAWTHGCSYPDVQIARALKYLFLAQVHDSLHGVGPSDMVADVKNRILQARVIADGITLRAQQSVAKAVDTSGIEDTDLFLVIFNPSSFLRDEVVEAYIDVPSENLDTLSLEEEDGRPVALHELGREKTRAGLYHPRSRNMPIYCTRVHVLIDTRDIPALGYKVLKVNYAEKTLYPYPHEEWDPLRIPFETLATGPRSAENEAVQLTIEADGTLQMLDKATGALHRGLHYFMDQGDSGNLYSHVPAGDLVSSLGTPARVSLVVNSPLLARFRVETSLSVPRRFDSSTGTRSADTVDIPLRSEISLRKGSGVVEIVTTFDNTAEDHFLRACFPTGIEAEYAHAEANFDVNAYPTKPSRDGELRGPELSRNRQHLFVDLSDGKNGFAILNDAVRDYEVTNADSGTLALSMVRSIRLRIPCDNRLWMEYPGDASAQAPGQHSMRYGLCTHAGGWEKGGIARHALAFNTPLRIAQIGRQSGDLPLAMSFLTIEGDGILLSCLKRAEDRESLVIRIVNPGTDTAHGRLVFNNPVAEAWEVDLNENRLSPVADVADNAVPITLVPGKILTVEAVF
ncbi:MAG: hypothetical protein HQ559_08510 [Lentisphaerae bacterium]|nr:hypothetical protein [Lentisphaerota bacterium]